MKGKQLEFILGVISILIILFLVYNQKAFLYAALAIAVACGLFPFIREGFYKIASAVLGFIGSITNKIILALVFFFIFFPFGLVLKLFGKLSLGKNMPGANSSFKERNHKFTKNDFENLW